MTNSFSRSQAPAISFRSNFVSLHSEENHFLFTPMTKSGSRTIIIIIIIIVVVVVIIIIVVVVIIIIVVVVIRPTRPN